MDNKLLYGWIYTAYFGGARGLLNRLLQIKGCSVYLSNLFRGRTTIAHSSKSSLSNWKKEKPKRSIEQSMDSSWIWILVSEQSLCSCASKKCSSLTRDGNKKTKLIHKLSRKGTLWFFNAIYGLNVLPNPSLFKRRDTKFQKNSNSPKSQPKKTNKNW